MVRGYEIWSQGRSSSTFRATGPAGRLDTVFVGILGTDFVDELLSHRERKLHLQWGDQPSFDCSLRDAAIGWVPLLPQSSEAHITSALSEEGVHLIGPLGDQAPPCIAPSCSVFERPRQSTGNLFYLMTRSRSLQAMGELVLRMNLVDGLAGSIVFLSDTTYLEFRRPVHIATVIIMTRLMSRT